MEKIDCSKLAKKLNIDLSYCNNMRFERTRMNYATPRDQDEYSTRFEHLSKRYTEINEKLLTVEKVMQDIQYRKTKTDMFLGTLNKQECLVTEFSNDLWYALADYTTVYSKENVSYSAEQN